MTCVVGLLFGVATAAAQSPSAPPTRPSVAEAEVRRLSDEEVQAFLGRNPQLMARLWSDAFVVTNPLNQFVTKQQVLAMVESGVLVITKFDRHIDYLRVYGDTVILAGRETVTWGGKMPNAGRTERLRITAVWMRESGAWRQVARHANVVPDDRPAPGGPPAADGASLDSRFAGRLPLPTRGDMRDDESVRIYDSLSGPNGEPPQGVVRLLLHSPATAAGFGRIERYLLNESALRGRLAALLTLVAAREMNLAYEWSVREAAARASGLEAEVIEVIRSNRPVAGLSRADALLIDVGRQLFRTRHVQSATFAALVDRLGRQGTFDAIMLLTYPAMAGVLERAVDLQPPQGSSATRLPRLAGIGTPTGRPGEFIALPERPPLPGDVHEDSYYRFPLQARRDLDTRTQALFDRVVGPDRVTTPRGPVGMTFLSPELVEPVQAINDALRPKGVLGTRLAEIVIAATGREMNSQYQWTVHGAAAAAAGAGQAVLDAIRIDGPTTALDERDAVAIEFTRQLFREETTRPETFARAVELFGPRGTIEIAALVGDYLMVTTMYNALGMRLRPEQAATLPHRAGAPVGAEWR